MATVDQYMAELDRYYAPQRDTVNSQLGALDPYYTQVLQGLEQTKANAFQDITNQANRRGVFYSGIPIEGQQKYVGEKYLPAVAGIKNEQISARSKLQQMLADLEKNRYLEAQGLMDRDRQFAAQQALNKSMYGGGGANSAQEETLEQAFQRYKAGYKGQDKYREDVIDALAGTFGLDGAGKQALVNRVYREMGDVKSGTNKVVNQKMLGLARIAGPLYTRYPIK